MPSLLAILGLNVGPFKSSASEARQIATHLGEHIKEELGKFVAIGALEESVRRTIEWAANIDDLSQRFDVNRKAIQAWADAVSLSGGSIESVGKFWQMLAKSRDKAIKSGDFSDFSQFGISEAMVRYKDKFRLEDLSLKIAEVMEHGDQQKLMGPFLRVGGRGAGELIAAFRHHLAEHVADALGYAVDEGGIKALKKADDIGKKTGHGFRAAFAAAMATGLGLFGAVWHSLGDPGFIRRKFLEFQANQKRKPEGGGVGSPEGSGMSESEDGTTEDGETPATKERTRLRKELAKLEQDNYFKSLSREGQILYLTQRRKQILDEINVQESEEGSVEGALKAKIELAKLDTELRGPRVVGGVETEKKARPERVGRGNLNSLQSIGGMFVSPLENTMTDLARQTAHNTKRMADHMTGHGHKTGWNHSKHS